MIYESSYETGHQPFVADLKRGYWSSANDFIYAGISLGFRLDVFALSWIANVKTGVSGFIPTYLISMALYVVPLLVVKSFLGQFSSSGFISALRLCPLFKGIGFVTLFLNICALIFYSVFAMIPLVYLIASLNPTLPWSCDGARNWTQKDILLCPKDGAKQCDGDCFGVELASTLYFQQLFDNYTIFGMTFSLSWHLVLSTLGVWTIITFIVYKLPIEKIGLLVRYSVWCLIAILLILIGRFSLLPGTAKHYERIFKLEWDDFFTEIMKIPAYGLCAFGPGWGLFITLASFNHFKTNITRSSWLICIGQMFIIFGLDMLENFIHLFFKTSTNSYYFRPLTQLRTLFMSSGSALATMEWPNMWCILLYLMLTLASMILMILQLHSILASIFDEYISLRQSRNRISFKIIAIMAMISLYFATRHGFESSTDLILDTIFGQSLINLLLILIVTWIYGRVRFQRDMTFMTGRNFATWKIYILRFFAPLCILAVLFVIIIMSLVSSIYSNANTTGLDIILKTLPWWLLPAYIIYCLCRSQGSLKERFIKCCRPTDWYPVEADERQRYEEIMNVSNMTHPLNELTWDDEYANVDYFVNA